MGVDSVAGGWLGYNNIICIGDRDRPSPYCMGIREWIVTS